MTALPAHPARSCLTSQICPSSCLGNFLKMLRLSHLSQLIPVFPDGPLVRRLTEPRNTKSIMSRSAETSETGDLAQVHHGKPSETGSETHLRQVRHSDLLRAPLDWFAAKCASLPTGSLPLLEGHGCCLWDNPIDWRRSAATVRGDGIAEHLACYEAETLRRAGRESTP